MSAATRTSAMSIKASATTLRILHLALTASVVIYGVVLHVVIAQPTETAPPTLDQNMPLFLVLAALAIGTALIGIPIARARVLPPRLSSEHRGDVPEGALPRAASVAIGKFFTGCILTWALCESIAIYGLVLGFLVREAWIFYCFGGPSLALMLFFAPRVADLEAVVRAALRTDE